MSEQHLRGLNTAQERAVRRIDGPLLVLAGAGTGKTRVVTCRIAEILRQGATPDQICAVTFTNKAAREMRERVRALLSGTKLSGMVVSTFHSLGLRILREWGARIGLEDPAIADVSDQESVIEDALREAGVGRDALHPRDARFRISLWKNRGLFPDAALEAAADPLETRLAVAYERYAEELRRRRLLDFDDLILLPLALLAKDAEVLRALHDRWRFLLVDEYQDTNGCQYQLVRRLSAARRNLCVVGDDDQSIYAWRGAEPRRILGFKKDFPEAEVVTLDLNYRSTAEILAVANKVIAGNVGRYEKALRATQGSGPPPHLYLASDEKDEMDAVVRRLLRLREEERLRWEDAAVLFRANSQCRPLEQALRERQIPYRVVGTRSFFDRREIRDLLAYLRLAARPGDDAAFLRIVNTPPRGIGKGTVDKVIAEAAAARASLLPTLARLGPTLAGRARDGARELDALVADLAARAEAEGPAAALDLLIERTAYKAHLDQTNDDALDAKKRQAAVDGLLETARDLGRTPEGRQLAGFLDALSLSTDERDEGGDRDAPAVTLLTMHAAKGLEFPVVFIVGAEEGIIPHDRTVRDEEDDPGTLGIEEERRLFYVAVTRARRRLFLSLSRTRRRFGAEVPRSQSRFLDEVGTDLLDVQDSADPTPATAESSKEWLARIRSRFRGGAAGAESGGG